MLRFSLPAALVLVGAMGVGGAAVAGPVEDAAHEALRAELAEISRSPGVFGRVFGGGAKPAARLERLLDAHWTWAMAVQPETASFYGDSAAGNRWTDLDPAAVDKVNAMFAEILTAANTIPADRLDEDDQVTLELFRYNLEIDVAGAAFPEHLLLIDQMNGAQRWIPRTLASSPLKSRADVDNYITRLETLPRLVSQIEALLREGLAQGVTPPKVTLAKVPDQLRALVPEDPTGSGLIKPLDGMPESLPAEFRDQARKRAMAAYRDKARPALSGLLDFLTQTYIPGARETTAMGDMPDGQVWYAHRVRDYTTTDLSVADIHKIGVMEVERIKAEMLKLIEAEGFKGGIAKYTKKLNKDRSQYPKNADEQLMEYRALGKKVDPLMVKLFGRLPQMPYGIEPIPDHAAPGSPIAYYLPGSFEASRPGVFYLNGHKYKEMPRYEMEALLLHEAAPGHHFQIALAQELGDMPEFRRKTYYTAYVEGWGLYAESLGPELGLYKDPKSRYGALGFEMWRAVRLVVDTGMHALGWSREQAIDYFHEHTGRDRDRITTEIDRYLVYPGQALAYKIGQLKILELRAEAEKRLGEAFDIRAFHEAVLGAGSLPITVLERRVRAWIDAQASLS